MQAEHPGEEEEMILNDRVLGAIAVTRGKVKFLVPAIMMAYEDLHQRSVTMNLNYLQFTRSVF